MLVSYVAEVMADSPVAWYRMDEATGTTLIDRSGNGRNGVYGGSPGLGAASLIPNAPGNASVDFDGINDYASIPDAPWMDFTTAFSAEVWANPDVDPGGSLRIMVGRLNSWYLATLEGVGLYYELDGTSSGVDALYADDIDQVVMTFDGTDIRVYLDGALAATTSRPGSIAAGSEPITIGALRTPTTTNRWSGLLDEVSLYDTCLSDARVAAHYDAGMSDKYPFSVAVTMLDGTPTSADGPVPGEAFSVPVTMLDGTIPAAPTEIVADTSNAFNGRNREGYGIITAEPTYVPLTPSGTTRVEKAVPFPMPVLVNGRPT